RTDPTVSRLRQPGPAEPRRPLPPELDPRRGRPAQGDGGYGLDDPDPYRYVPGGGEPPRPPRRGAGQRVLFGVKLVAAAMSVLVLLASGYLWWVYRDFNGKVARVNAIGASTV